MKKIIIFFACVVLLGYTGCAYLNHYHQLQDCKKIVNKDKKLLKRAIVIVDSLRTDNQNLKTENDSLKVELKKCQDQ
jgi:Txe/YoeB family toxin of Txe-Axe toxin-antitoxin module